MDLAEPLLPRSAVLALWLATSPRRTARVVEVVEGDDEPHTVAGVPHLPDGAPLADLVADWAADGPPQTAALLPVPGDVAGVPAEVSDAAVEARECLLVHAGGRAWAAVPEVVGFGSVHEPGHLVTWRVSAVADWRARLPGVVGSLAEAEQSLRGALRQATEALTSLDVARWRPDAAAALEALRSGPALPLPLGLDPRVVRVLADAARLRAIVALATADDGGAVNLWQADQRSAALRHVDHAARRAVAAATARPSVEPAGH